MPYGADRHNVMLEHLRHAIAYTHNATPVDDVGRRALIAARGVLESAKAEYRGGHLAGADQLAAASEELVAAARGEASGADAPSAEAILGELHDITVALAGVQLRRVRNLLTLANDVAMNARVRAAAGEGSARRAAMRAESIALAAVHVAMAADPDLASALPPPAATAHSPHGGP